MSTYTTQSAIGEREQLADVIFRIDPDETPIFSALKKETTNGIFTEWQTQELAAAANNNFHTEGADATYAAATPTVRLGNYHQISQKAVTVSKTLDIVEKSGPGPRSTISKSAKIVRAS